MTRIYPSMKNLPLKVKMSYTPHATGCHSGDVGILHKTGLNIKHPETMTCKSLDYAENLVRCKLN